MKRFSDWFLVAVALFASSPKTEAQMWPVLPNADSPLGTSFGEFQYYYLKSTSSWEYYMHSGVDIRGDPYVSSSNPGTIVVAVADGTVKDVINTLNAEDNVVEVLGNDTFYYRYLHLTNIDSAVVAVGLPVQAGITVLGSIMDWKNCGASQSFNHLHFEIEDRSGATPTLLSPLTHTRLAVKVGPDPDLQLPKILSLVFAVDTVTPWGPPPNPFIPYNPSPCTPLKGKVDIFVKFHDQDDANNPLSGTEALGVRRLRWHAELEGNPPGAWNDADAILLDEMPTAWSKGVTGSHEARTYYGVGSPPSIQSESDYCKDSWLLAAVTNCVAKQLNPTGNWDTATGANGMYTVTVEVTDFMGNSTIANTRVCIANPGGSACLPDLTIRDGPDDTGAVPYLGDVAYLSPDIKVNPSTAWEDTEVKEAMMNSIIVTMHNYGCCDIPARTKVDVSLGWGPATTSMPATTLIQTKPIFAPAGGWPAGIDVPVTFNWTPAAGSLPLGHSCLKAWLAMTDDPLLPGTAVRLDDNKAQRNISFVGAPPPPPPPPPGTPGPPTPPSPAYTEFYLNPDEGVGERVLELKLARPEEGQRFSRMTLHIGPGFSADAIHGGKVLGDYKGNVPAALDKLTPPDPKGVQWKQATAQGRTVVIELEPGRSLRFDNVLFQETVKLRLEAIATSKAEKGQVTEVRITERGIPKVFGQTVELGGLAVRFEH